MRGVRFPRRARGGADERLPVGASGAGAGRFGSSAGGADGGRELRARRVGAGGGGAGRRGSGAWAAPGADGGCGRAGRVARPDGWRACSRCGAAGGLSAALSGGFRARLAGRGGFCVGGAAACGSGSLDRLGRGGTPGAPAPGGGAVAVPDPSGRGVPEPGLARAWSAAAAAAFGLRGALRLRAVPGGDVRRRHALGNQPAGGQLASAGRDRGSGPAGSGQRGGGGTQAGVCLRAGGRLASASGGGRGAVPGAAAGALGGAGGWRLGGERVRRGAAGRCPAERPAGAGGGAQGGGSDGFSAGRGEGGSGTGQGPLPVRGSSGRQRGDAGEHPAPAPRADAAAHARGAAGAVPAGRHGPQLRQPSGLRRTGGDRRQPDRRAQPRPASALDAGGDPVGVAAGGGQRALRRAGAEGGSGRGVAFAQERALDRGAAGLRRTGSRAGPRPGRERDGSRGRRLPRVRDAARAAGAGRAGARQRPPPASPADGRCSTRCAPRRRVPAPWSPSTA